MTKHERGGHYRGVRVKLADKTGKDLAGSIFQARLHREELRAEQSTAAQETDLHASVSTIAFGHGHDIRVVLIGPDDLLPFQHVLDGCDPIAEFARAFEIPGVGGLGHLLLERPQDLIRLTVEKHRRGVDGLHVCWLVNQRDTGRGALVQVVVETDLFIARDALVAFPIRKEPVQQVEVR